MAGTKPKIRFGKVIEILLWLAGRVALDKRERNVKRHFSEALLRSTAMPEWLRTETLELSR